MEQNTTSSKEILKKILRLKCEMLCNGIYVDPDLLIRLDQEKRPLNLGRKGGAGPAGGRYFEFPDKTILNTQLFVKFNPKLHLTMIGVSDQNQITLSSLDPTIPLLPLTLVQAPAFYSQFTSDHIEFKKIALIHGNETLATTVNQHCQYWQNNQQCKFCAIEFSLQNDTTIAKKNAQQILETITIARKENPRFAQHITLTIGTQPTPDKGILEYIPIIEAIKKSFPEIQIHIQIEPIEDVSLLKKVQEIGADTIGIHIEILDDTQRKIICPGKSHITKHEYYRNWDAAVKFFGKNQVDSFVLTGFKTNGEEFKQELENMVAHGVIPYLTPARSIPGVLYSISATDAKNFFDLLLYVAELCKLYRINPLLNRAGCVRCGGCSPILDAYRIISFDL